VWLKVIIAEPAMPARASAPYFRPQIAKDLSEGKRVVRTRFGVDPDVAPATIPASDCPAALGSRSHPIQIRCGLIPSHM